jgi:hypothetical protein
MIAGGPGQQNLRFLAVGTAACFWWRLALNLGNKHGYENNVKKYLLPDGFLYAIEQRYVHRLRPGLHP